MTVKLTLDAGALELLFNTLGTDFILKIRQAALEDVAGRTVHAIITKEVRKAVDEATRDEIAKLVTTKKVARRVWGSPSTVIELKEEIAKLIASTAQSEIYTILNKIFDSDELTLKLQGRIDQRVDSLKRTINEKVTKEINEATEQYIVSEVNRRIKEIANKVHGG